MPTMETYILGLNHLVWTCERTVRYRKCSSGETDISTLLLNINIKKIYYDIYISLIFLRFLKLRILIHILVLTIKVIILDIRRKRAKIYENT